MNSELLGGRALVAFIAIQHALNHALFQDFDGLLQK